MIISATKRIGSVRASMAIVELVERAIEKERQRCIKVIDSHLSLNPHDHGSGNAMLIIDDDFRREIRGEEAGK